MGRLSSYKQKGQTARLVLSVATAVATLLCGGASAFGQEDAECAECHSPTAHKPQGTRFDIEAFRKSAHGKKLECIACHDAIEDLPHEPKLAAVECGACHGKAEKAYRDSIHARKSQSTHAPGCVDCHGSHTVAQVADQQSPAARLNIPAMCGDCHASVEKTRLRRHGDEAPYEAYKKSVHGRLILEEHNAKAAVCSDCHDAHSQKRKHDPSAKIFAGNISKTCGACHEEIQAHYERSIHGEEILKKENYDKAPTCVSCHSEHNILPPDEKLSTVYGPTITRSTCLACHQSLTLITGERGYAARRFEYRDSYHGAASRSGRIEVANCASCHGHHDILPSSDPRSSIHPDNLAATCGECHPNAGANFTRGRMHVYRGGRDERSPADWVRLIYLWLIAVVIGGMFLHNGLVFGHFVARREHPAPVARHATYLRFTRFERVQHWLLAALFVGLVISGFAYRYPEAFLVRWWVGSESGFVTRDVLHRVFGASYIALMLVHLGAMTLTGRGRALLGSLWPRLDDLKQGFGEMAFLLGRRKTHPTHGMFDYAEKMEYWALCWGSAVMVLSGVPMWFENWALSWMPRWALDVCRAFHFYEAILASLAIVVWHLFFVIFHPRYYPMRLSMVTGRDARHEGVPENLRLDWKAAGEKETGTTKDHEAEPEGSAKKP